MKQELEQSILFCIEALNNNNRANGSQKVEGNDKFVLSTLRKISKLPYQGRNLGIGDLGYKDGDRHSFEDMLRDCPKKSITYSLDWLDALLVLLDFANYDEIQILDFAKRIVNDDIIFNHVLKHIISNCVVLNDIETAEKFIPNFKKTIIFKEEDNFDMGYLIFLKHFAMKGDVENYFKYFKKSKPATNRYEVSITKSSLVRNYATKHNMEESMKLCEHKNLGHKFYFDLLTAYSDQGKYQELKNIFEQHSQLKQPELETELKILATAYQEAKRRELQVDDDFEELFDRAKKVDRKLRWGDFKLQDSIFFDLGLASFDNAERVKRCRKAIKNNSMKKEL
ncbi:hypothetical protein [Bacteroides sp. 224]|uniref:hypothetical protein n=1 Tax=Bacteroides sp. 224 TaxID=2302936 RepID=UPI0013D12752|nr:hypothetical protein [Bacteroides sp. 224]NDV65201.1 hypothetical protein [Bacteroides sp. 224]